MLTHKKTIFMFYLYILLLFVPSITPLSTTANVERDEDEGFNWLPNEIPEFTSKVEFISDSTNKEKFKALKNIIGYLPFPVQNALIDSIDGTTTFFDESKFKKAMNKTLGGTLNSDYTNLYSKEGKAISNFIKRYERTLPYGVGSLHAVSNKYSSYSNYNLKAKDKLYACISNVFIAQNSYLTVLTTSLDAILKSLFNRRSLLFTIKSDEIPIENSTSTESDLLLSDNETVYGLNVKGDDILTSIKGIRTAASEYAKVLSFQSLKGIRYIASMDGCRNFKADTFSGNSSDQYTYFGFETDLVQYENGKRKVTNYGKQVRYDHKTVNGYNLLGGIRTSSQIRDDENFSVSDINKEAFAAITSIYSSITSALSTGIVAGKESNFYGFIGITKLIQSSTIELSLKAFDQTLLTSIQDKTCENTYFCPAGGDCLSFTNVTTTNNFGITTGFVSCTSGLKPSVVIYDGTKKTISVVSNGKDTYASHYQIIQACFGAFSGGSDGDKDSCREAMTRECATDLDFTSKKTGFYDYINAHPPFSDTETTTKSKNIISDDDVDKYYYIQNLVGGDIAIRPSGILGINLFMDSVRRGQYKKNRNNYATDSTMFDKKLTALTDGSQSTGEVAYENELTFANDVKNDLYFDKDKSAHVHIKNSAGYYKYNLLFSGFVILMMIIL